MVKNSYNRQETTNFLYFQHTVAVPQIIHPPNIFSFLGYECATMIPLLYPPNSLPFSGLYLMIPLFRWSMKISINQRQTFDLKRCMIIFVIVNMYILMQISPFLLYSATVGDGIKCYTVGGQGMPQWSTCHPKLSGYRAVSMSWTQSLFHHCHISHFWNFEHVITQSLVQYCHSSHFQNFENVMNTSVIGSQLSCQWFT